MSSEHDDVDRLIGQCLVKLSVSKNDIPARYKLCYPICMRENLFVSCVADLQIGDYHSLVAKIGKGSQIENEVACLTRMNEIDNKLDGVNAHLCDVILFGSPVLTDFWFLSRSLDSQNPGT